MSFNSFEKLHDGKYLSPATVIHTDNEVIRSFIRIYYDHTENVYGAITFHVGIGEDVKSKIREAFGDVYQYHPEGYAILLEDDIAVYAESETCFAYAAADLWRMSDRDFLKQGIIYNRPLAEMRYLKLFTPAESEFEDFKKIVD